MRPDTAAGYVLRTTRARAKMHEFRVDPAHYVDMPRDPDVLFGLAIGLLGDAARSIAEEFEVEEIASQEATGEVEGEDDTSEAALRFAATFFDAYLEAKLDDSVNQDFSLLCATSYYLADVVAARR